MYDMFVAILQAVMSSDFAISRFKHLRKLLLVHGHWCYTRLANMILYFIYKNVVRLFSTLSMDRCEFCWNYLVSFFITPKNGKKNCESVNLNLPLEKLWGDKHCFIPCFKHFGDRLMRIEKHILGQNIAFLSILSKGEVLFTHTLIQLKVQY